MCASRLSGAGAYNVFGFHGFVRVATKSSSTSMSAAASLFRIITDAAMGAFIVTYPRDRIKAVLLIFVFVKITFIPAALLIGFWFLTQLVHAGSVAKVQTGGVAYLAHVGGFVSSVP
jgi:membrane associated rhomboid family serine protease